MSMNEKAVVLLSGGQDSTTCLFWARERFSEVLALSVYYGQRHAREMESARKIAELAGVGHIEISIPQFSFLADSALTHQGPKEAIQAAGGLVDKHAPNGLPNTFVPGRNALFLTLAASLAVSKKYQVLVTGVCETDYSGYPDCRERFITSMERALQDGMPSGSPLRIATPLMFQNKRHTVMMAHELGPDCWAAIGLSTTCYEGERPGCSFCPACVLRAKGFVDAGLTDPARTA